MPICRKCGKRKGSLSWQKLCNKCSEAKEHLAIAQMRAKEGPVWEKWKKGLMEAVVKADQESKLLMLNKQRNRKHRK